VVYGTPKLVVFTGREHGAYTRESDRESDRESEAMTDISDFHSLLVFRYFAAQGGWRLVYHSVWLNDAEQLARFQRSVRGA
jgi:hypothetical protein